MGAHFELKFLIRNSIIYIVLPWTPILQSWLLKRPKQESDLLDVLFGRIFSDLMNFIKINTNPKMAVPECVYIRQATDILMGLIPSRDQTAAAAGNFILYILFYKNHANHSSRLCIQKVGL